MTFVGLLATAQLLHIPDGFLNLPISLICWLVTLVVLATAVRRAQKDYDERLIPLAGIMAAFVFAGQMINFPVAGGTSGHLFGATLAFVVLGPWVGALAMTAVIVLQALLFQDGGLVVMGANILVMGIAPGFVGYGIYHLTSGWQGRLRSGGTAVAAWLAVMMAAFITALLLAFSGTASLSLALPAMLGVHAFIGIGEALITIAALGFIRQTRPQLLTANGRGGGGRWVAAGIFITLLIVLFSPFASQSPDGLEWVAAQKSFINSALATPYEILPNYSLPILGETGLSTIVAGVIGVALLILIMFSVGRLLRRHGNNHAQAHDVSHTPEI
jgi:cobalt/nickel transport system permease protein